jgi:hypothetical protein
MRTLSQEELKEKRLRAITRLVCQIFDGRVVDKPRRESLTSTGYLLRRFLVKPLPENWGEAAHVIMPEPGNCENCPACVKWPESAHNKYLGEIRRKKAGKPVCCYGPYLLGSGAKKDRPKVITERVRKACPLKNHKPQPWELII